MHNLFRVMLYFNDTMGYGVPPEKWKNDPVCMVLYLVVSLYGWVLCVFGRGGLPVPNHTWFGEC